MNIFSKKQVLTDRKRRECHRICHSAALLCLLWTAPSAAQTGAVSSPIGPAAASDSVHYEYEADRVEYDFQTRRVVLIGNAVFRYREMELSAGRIVVDRRAQRLEAEALPDSTGEKRIGLPHFTRGREYFSGSEMVYGLETGHGRVRGGRAVHQRKYYHGEDILLNNQRELHARDLSISTCEKDHVHYDFLCGDLKVLENDKAIARSVTFRIGPLPVAWMPFYVFPIKASGRQSGLLTPSVGSNSRYGVHVGNLGYYLAPSEYWDATLRATLRERGGFLLDSRFVYAVRSRLRGSVDFSFENGSLSGTSIRNWRLNLYHQQRLNPTLNIRGSGNFTSSASFDRRNSNNLYQFLNQQLRSSFSLDKQWTESNRSLDASLTYYRDQDNNRNSFQGFPRLSFRQGRRAILGGPSGTFGVDRPWYQSIYYSFSGDLDTDFTRTPNPVNNTHNLTLGTRLFLNSQHRPFGWLDFTPSLAIGQTSSRNNQDRPTRRESYIASVSSSTTLYGIFRPRIGRIRGIRHRMQPQVDFRYSQLARVEGGTLGFGGKRIWGDPRRSLNMALGNTFEIKTETEGKERRSTFATARLSTGYDFDLPGQKWQPLRTTVSVKPNRRVDIRMRMAHELYNDQGRFSLLSPRLRSFSVTSNFRFRGRTERAAPDTERRPGFPTRTTDFGFERDLYGEFDDVTQPWRFTLAHYFDLQKRFGTTQKRSWIKASYGFNPTQSWRFDYAINYDMVRRDITAQNLSIYRSLHCWEARFSWYPTGFNRGFYFKINIKDIPQIKFEHRRGGFGV